MIHPHIDSFIKTQIKQDEPGAAIAVIHHGEVIHQAGYGLANLEWNIPISTDTLFRIASITQTFTAAAIMMLVEQEKIDLANPITDYLPDFHTSGHFVTVEHLLNHSSGIHDYYAHSLPGEDFLGKLRRKITPPELVQAIARVPFDFKPGAQADYSSSNYVLLAQIIEKTSGQSYDSFVQENILNPLGMNHTCFLDDSRIFPRLASGYFNSERGVILVPYFDISWMYGSGGMASSLIDLTRWDAAVREGKLLTPESFKAVFTPLLLEDDSSNPYGFSWSVSRYEDHTAVYHSGKLPGFRSLLLGLPEDDLSIIVLSNYDGEGVNPFKVGTLIVRYMLDLPEVKRRPFILGGEVIAKYTGQFGAIQITVTEGKFFAIQRDPIGEATRLRLMPFGSTQFYNTDFHEETFTFKDEQKGVFTTLIFNSPLKGVEIYKRI